MKIECAVLVLAGLVLSAGPIPVGAAFQTVDEESGLELVFTCPVHRDVTETGPGNCHICDRPLVHALVQRAWSCPIHAVISEGEPGECAICGRTLYRITEEVSFVCPMHPDVRELGEGTCPTCNMPLVAETAARPHQDHNPKHGGLFFMAPDNWHHLEGAYPEPGVFRVYLYDNFSQPMDAKSFEARAVLKEVFDPQARKTREVVAYPLLPAPDGAYLEAHVGSEALPRAVTAKIRFERDGPFERFDFIFAELSRDAEVDTAVDPTSAPALEIPGSAAEIAAEIEARNAAVRDLIEKGALNRIYVPALEAKDLAVALEGMMEEVPEARRGAARWALKQLVRSAWLLDDYGDLGNREKVHEVYALFDEAVAEIESAYGPKDGLP